MTTSKAHLRDASLLDPENDVEREHLARCPRCAARREVLDRVRRAVSALPREAAPPEAALRLLDAPPSRRSPPRRGVAVAVAASLVLALGVARWRAGPRSIPASLAHELALDHLHYHRRADLAERSGAPSELEDFFEQTLARRPRLAMPEATRLVGGKRCRIGGRWSALVWLERAGRWVSLFSLPQEVAVASGCLRVEGVNVCGGRDPRGGSRVLVADLPDAELLRLMEESMQ